MSLLRYLEKMGPFKTPQQNVLIVDQLTLRNVTDYLIFAFMSRTMYLIASLMI